jgi:predicted nuclease of predicted toxin-antitoxin system
VPAEIRFHLDECVMVAVGDGLRRRGIDVTTTPESELLSSDDLDQLAFASREGRVLITQDADFLRLAQEGRPHCGITYYAPGTRTIGELISRLALIHAVLNPEEMNGMIEFL